MSSLLELFFIAIGFLVIGSIIVFGTFTLIARLFFMGHGPYNSIKDDDDDFISPFNMFQDFNKIDKY